MHPVALVGLAGDDDLRDRQGVWMGGRARILRSGCAAIQGAKGAGARPRKSGLHPSPKSPSSEANRYEVEC